MMKNYQNLSTKKFNNQTNEPITLLEYKMFKDIENELNFVVLKMKNQTDDTLTKLSLKIIEFDNKNVAIKEKQYDLTNLKVDGKKKFVPVNKFVLDDDTKNIKVTIISSTLEPVIVENKVIEKPESIVVKKRMYPIMVSVVLSALVIILMSLTLVKYHYNTTSNVNEFNYVELGNNEISIETYNWTNPDIVIPRIYKSKRVVKIENNAFRDSEVRNIVIRAEEIEIGDSAFNNAFKLKTIRGLKITKIGKKAFANAVSLKTFEFEEVESIGSGAFSNTSSLKEILISNIENTIFEDGALDGSSLNNLEVIEGLIILNKTLISTIRNLEDIYLDKSYNIENISNFAFSNVSSSVISIEIATPNVNINKEMFKGLNNLKSVILNQTINLDENIFEHLPRSLIYLEIPITGNNLADLFSNDYFYIKEVTILDVQILPDSYKTGNYYVESWNTR